MAALPGFMLGYLPYSLYKDELDAFFFSRGFMKEKNMLELLPENPYVRYGFAILHSALLIALLIWAIKEVMVH